MTKRLLDVSFRALECRIQRLSGLLCLGYRRRRCVSAQRGGDVDLGGPEVHDDRRISGPLLSQRGSARAFRLVLARRRLCRAAFALCLDSFKPP